MSPLAQIPTPPPVPGVPGVPGFQTAFQTGATTSLDQLVARSADLQRQLSSLRAQQSELRRLGQSSDNAVRSATREQLGQVNMQAAQVRTELASVNAAIRSALPQGVAGTTTQPENNNRGNVPGEAIAAMSVVFMLAVLMPISIAFARRIWRRGSSPKQAEDVVSPRLDRLENAVDAIAIEIERISEGQRFVTKVMTERPTPRAHAAPAPEHAEASALGEAKPFLALGAGPIEPIPVAQRQAVRQSITPH
jgi:hypothetical protein